VRRRQGAKEPPKATIRRCERCGATASTSALLCTICGQPFASADKVSQLWGPVEQAPSTDDAPLADLYTGEGDGRVFRSGGHTPALEPALATAAPAGRPNTGATADPWASASGTLSTLPGKPGSGGFVAPGDATEEREGRRRGSGLRRVLVALLLILVAGGAAGWVAGRPYLSGQIADNVGGAVDDELEGLSALPADEGGRITVVERDITRVLRADADAYAPLTNPRVALSRNGVRVSFTLYGAAHTLTGTLVVVDHRLTIQSPVLEGPASRLVDLTDVTAATEESIADMFARLDARPVSVKTSDDTLVIVTEPV
jgi:hypothetical protein